MSKTEIMIRTYDCPFYEIQEQDRPEEHSLFMCIDPANLLWDTPNNNTWVVARMGKNLQFMGLGVFWKREHGELFLQALIDGESDHE